MLGICQKGFCSDAKSLAGGKQTAEVATKEGLTYCNQLFALEHKMHTLSPGERYEMQLTLSLPLVDDFQAWLVFQRPRVLPKSAFGQAIFYCLNQWDKLTAFLRDGRLELDNNRAERSIKPIVIGRKNWLFSNTPRGARASATIYSIVETAKENSLNPFAYIKYLFEKLPNVDINDEKITFIEISIYFQAGLCGSSLEIVKHCFVTVQGAPRTVFTHLTEQTVLNWVPLGCARWIMTYRYRKPKNITELFL